MAIVLGLFIGVFLGALVWLFERVSGIIVGGEFFILAGIIVFLLLLLLLLLRRFVARWEITFRKAMFEMPRELRRTDPAEFPD